jgi:Ca2+-dependent lipid-binding protein
MVKVVRAEISRDKNLLSSMDPYCIIRTNAGEVKTSVAKGMGKNPVWSDSFNINFNGDTTLYVGMWDKDTFTPDDIIAETTINLMGNLTSGQPFSGWHPLFYKGQNAGQIYVEILFNSGGDRGNLTTGSHQTTAPHHIPTSHHVSSQSAQGNHAFSGMAVLRVVRAELTRDKALLTNMDPYVVVRTNAAEVQTNVAMNQGRTPSWNNSFNLNLTGDQLFHIAVYDKSLLKDGLIGETTLNLGTALNNGRYSGWIPLYYKGESAGQVFLEVEAANCTTAPGSNTSGPCPTGKVC